LLRSSLTGSMKFAPHPYLRIGSRVRIAGDRSGASREFCTKKNEFRVVLSIDVMLAPRRWKSIPGHRASF